LATPGAHVDAADRGASGPSLTTRRHVGGRRTVRSTAWSL